MKLWTTIIGGIAAFGTTCAWMPQVFKTWKTRSADDFSWSYLAMFTTGVSCWLVYGFMKKDYVIVAANGVTLLLVITIIFVKARER
jgi:MtN3 and saliva related transmembrane protein